MHNVGEVTESMEDYLEMSAAVWRNTGMYGSAPWPTSSMSVPPRSLRWSAGLRELGLVQFEKYGLITLTKKGDEIAAYLLWRHDVLLRFFQRLNHTGGQLSLVEQVEHFMDQETVRNLERLLDAFPKDFEK